MQCKACFKSSAVRSSYLKVKNSGRLYIADFHKDGTEKFNVIKVLSRKFKK